MNDLENMTIYCHDKFEYTKLPGQKFEFSPKECLNFRHDEEGYCRGRPYGSSCRDNGDLDCDVDLFCDSDHRCAHAKAVGEFCENDEKCASYLLCVWEEDNHYRCRNYGLYPNGKDLGPSDEDDICQSNYIDHNFICQDGPRLIGSNLRENPNEICNYDRGSYEKSHCWYHAEGKAICKRGAGDLMNEWRIALSYLNLRPQCHVSIPMSQCDMGRKVVSSQAEWEKIWHVISMLHWETQVQGLAHCMKQYVHPEIFKFETNLSAPMVTTPLLSLLALLLLLL